MWWNIPAISLWYQCGYFMMFSECIVTSLNSFTTVLSLQELCSRAIVATTSVYGIEHLPLPQPIKSHLKSYTNHNHTTRLRQLRQVGNFDDIVCHWSLFSMVNLSDPTVMMFWLKNVMFCPFPQFLPFTSFTVIPCWLSEFLHIVWFLIFCSLW